MGGNVFRSDWHALDRKERFFRFLKEKNFRSLYFIFAVFFWVLELVFLSIIAIRYFFSFLFGMFVAMPAQNVPKTLDAITSSAVTFKSKTYYQSYYFTFKTYDGNKISARLLRRGGLLPSRKLMILVSGNSCSVSTMLGMRSDNVDDYDFFKELSARCTDIFIFDMPNVGCNKHVLLEHSHLTNTFLAAVDFARTKLMYSDFIFYGWSMGGSIVLKGASILQEKINKGEIKMNFSIFVDRTFDEMSNVATDFLMGRFNNNNNINISIVAHSIFKFFGSLLLWEVNSVESFKNLSNQTLVLVVNAYGDETIKERTALCASLKDLKKDKTILVFDYYSESGDPNVMQNAHICCAFFADIYTRRLIDFLDHSAKLFSSSSYSIPDGCFELHSYENVSERDSSKPAGDKHKPGEKDTQHMTREYSSKQGSVISF